jgi:hypothetical protein
LPTSEGSVFPWTGGNIQIINDLLIARKWGKQNKKEEQGRSNWALEQ